MTIPPAVLLLIGVALCGAAVALAAFVWAVTTGQLDQSNSGAYVIFDEEDLPGVPGNERREGGTP